MSHTHSTSQAAQTSPLVDRWRTERLDRDSATGGYRTAVDGTETVTTAIVLTTAVARNTEPTDLPPLTHALDPDALTHLVGASTVTDATLRFEYAGCSVTVDADGSVLVVPESADAT